VKPLRRDLSALARSAALALGSAACLVVAFLAYRAQLLTVLLIPFMAIASLTGVALRQHRWTAERFRAEFVRDLLAGRVGALEWVHAAVRCAFWLVLPWFIQLSIPRARIDDTRYWLYMVLVPCFVALVRIFVCELRPARTGHAVSVSVAMALAAAALLTEGGSFLLGPREPAVELAFPGGGSWIVVQGGVGRSFNRHYALPSQRHALDLDATEGGRPHSGTGSALTDYHCWGRPLFAPSAGKVVHAVGTLPDSQLGQTDRKNLAGNHVIVQIAPEQFMLLAHLQQGSVAVEAGDEVRAGQLLGRCGNSGNTSQPHLHLQVQTGPDMWAPDTRTLPMRFSGSAAPDRPARRNDELFGSFEPPVPE
jgi:hypothetical protein